MTIQEILEAHKVSAFAGSDTACSCDRTWRTNTEYRAHIAEVLEQHTAGREANAWDEGEEAGSENGRNMLMVENNWIPGFELIENPYRKETQ